MKWIPIFIKKIILTKCLCLHSKRKNECKLSSLWIDKRKSILLREKRVTQTKSFIFFLAKIANQTINIYNVLNRSHNWNKYIRIEWILNLRNTSKKWSNQKPVFRTILCKKEELDHSQNFFPFTVSVDDCVFFFSSCFLWYLTRGS